MQEKILYYASRHSLWQTLLLLDMGHDYCPDPGGATITTRESIVRSVLGKMRGCLIDVNVFDSLGIGFP